MNLQGKIINVLGDSITQGAGVADPANFFCSRLAQRLGATVNNYGIGGTRIARQHTLSNEIHDQYFLSRVAGMAPDADVVMVFGGTNDYGHGDAPLGQPDSRDDGTFYGALNLLYEALLNKYPAAAIVVCTPLHRLNEEREINELGVRNVATLNGYRRCILERAAHYGLPVLDLYAVSGMQPAVEIIREKYMPDGLHPNDDGHAILTDKMEAFLRGL